MVIWIGGIIFILFIALPSSKQVMGAEAGKVMGEISSRFTPLANFCIVSLIVSGAALAGLHKQPTGVTETDWPFIVKLFAASGMVVIHFYRGLVLTPKIAKTEPAAKKASLQKLSLKLVKCNFALVPRNI